MKGQVKRTLEFCTYEPYLSSAAAGKSGLDMKVGRCPGETVTAPQLVAVGMDGKSPYLLWPTWRVLSFHPLDQLPS